LAKFTSLKIVDFGANYFDGTIPDDLAGMTILEHFDISRTDVTGNIWKNFVANWKKLRYLDVSHTSLTGTIPPTILGSLTDLEALLLKPTFFTGVLPSEVSQLTQLKKIEVKGDEVMVPFPDISKLTNLSKA
jgi:hypothetical protein